MNIKRTILLSTLLSILFAPFVLAKDEKEKSNPLASIKLRSIGPAMISGRISDFAFNPDKPNEFYVATASGNLWKTSNNMTTWQPLFENQGSYAIGVIEMAKGNTNLLWLGTGENNSQRSVKMWLRSLKSAA